ncbi:hypothetical protein BC941DRAFT_228976 [Chlamydoabsidia padenii]|nr:hypothetical protein BC941DRAFT_228976 [Chlamydoabsidia padenii]
MEHFKVWGIDPDVTEIFVASNSSDPRVYINATEMPEEPILLSPEEPHHQVRRFSAAELYCLAGFPKTNMKIKEWKTTAGIDIIESGFGSPKTASMEQVSQYIENKMVVLDRLLQFYGYDFQQLRFLNYHGRQKATQEMIKIFVNGGIKYGHHPDYGNSIDVQQQRYRDDGSKKRRRCMFEPTQVPPQPDV